MIGVHESRDFRIDSPSGVRLQSVETPILARSGRFETRTESVHMRCSLQDMLADSFAAFLAQAYDTVLRHRDALPSAAPGSTHRLEDLLRCLTLIHSSDLFRKTLPFQRALTSELNALLKKSAIGYYERAKHYQDHQRHAANEVPSSPDGPLTGEGNLSPDRVRKSWPNSVRSSPSSMPPAPRARKSTTESSNRMQQYFGTATLILDIRLRIPESEQLRSDSSRAEKRRRRKGGLKDR